MRFHLNDGKQLSKPGGNIRNIKQTYSSYAGSHHIQSGVYISLSQKEHPTTDRIQNESGNRTMISLFVNHFNKTILYALSEKLENMRHASEQSY